jgi:hypothetical protein
MSVIWASAYPFRRMTRNAELAGVVVVGSV